MGESIESSTSTECFVVSLTLEEGDAVVLTARCCDRWLYSEARTENIKSQGPKQRLQHLINDLKRLRDQEQEQEREEEKKRKAEAAKGDAEEDSEQESQKTRDSGYESTDSSNAEARKGSQDGTISEPDIQHTQSSEVEEEFEAWLVESLQGTCSELAKRASQGRERAGKSLEDWYKTEVLCFQFEAAEDSASGLLEPVSVHDLDIEQIQKTLTPGMRISKKVQNMTGVTWYRPEDLVVLEEEDNMHMSIHPTLLQTQDGVTTYFLKLAEPGFEPAVRREIDFLHKLTTKDLYSKGINAPRLTGLVSLPHNPTSHTHILGFLLSVIPQPARPLIEYMTADVPAAKRDAWAEQVERMVATLHEHGLVWGDGKADNFLVDASEELWIIDFGGSLTIGWIDEDLEETEEGDDMATRKIVNGLHDPENETLESITQHKEKQAQKEGEEKLDAQAEKQDRKADEGKKEIEDSSGLGNNKKRRLRDRDDDNNDDTDGADIEYNKHSQNHKKRRIS